MKLDVHWREFLKSPLEPVPHRIYKLGCLLHRVNAVCVRGKNTVFIRADTAIL